MLPGWGAWLAYVPDRAVSSPRAVRTRAGADNGILFPGALSEERHPPFPGAAGRCSTRRPAEAGVNTELSKGPSIDRFPEVIRQARQIAWLVLSHKLNHSKHGKVLCQGQLTHSLVQFLAIDDDQVVRPLPPSAACVAQSFAIGLDTHQRVVKESIAKCSCVSRFSHKFQQKGLERSILNVLIDHDATLPHEPGCRFSFGYPIEPTAVHQVVEDAAQHLIKLRLMKSHQAHASQYPVIHQGAPPVNSFARRAFSALSQL